MMAELVGSWVNRQDHGLVFRIMAKLVGMIMAELLGFG